MRSLAEYLAGICPVEETLDWLAEVFLPDVQQSLNRAPVRACLGLYGREEIPTNERNLTDTRVRVSLVYEFQLAEAITDRLSEQGSCDFCAYVVANRFPDLEIRAPDGSRGLRLEVKCMQSIAEEKAANFATLIKDVDPQVDFLIVFLWEWDKAAGSINWVRAPRLLNSFAFNAYALGRLRDWYWLNKPGKSQGDAYQGFDLRGAVTAKAGSYRAEGNNYGKLLRLWDDDLAYKPSMDALMRRTASDYLAFKRTALNAGFDTLAGLVPDLGAGDDPLRPILHDKAPLGFSRGRLWYILESRIGLRDLAALMDREGITDVIRFSDRYLWRHYRREKGRLFPLPGSGRRKFKHLSGYLARL